MSKLPCSSCTAATASPESEEIENAENVFPGEPDEVFFSRAGHRGLKSEVDLSDLPTGNFQREKLPAGAKFVSASPVFTERSLPAAIRRRHLAPKDKCGLLVVRRGAVQFVWEDTGEILDADVDHPVVIWPERFHHIQLTGAVELQIEFYSIPAGGKNPAADSTDAPRPGERFIPE